MSSSIERLRILPRASPTLRNDFVRSSVLISLLPLIVEGADGRPLLHDHHQRRFIAAQLDVAKEAGVVECAQRLADALCIERVADVHGQ